MNFEEYEKENWLCPKCGETDKVRIEQVVGRNFERDYFSDKFVLSGTIYSRLRVFCRECNSECYME